jgi:hypothetical protein
LLRPAYIFGREQPNVELSPMPATRPQTRRVPLAPPLLAGLSLVGIGFANAGSIVELGFERAFEHRLQSQAAFAQAPTDVAGAGSEEFWLSRARDPATRPVSWSRPLAPGDRISIKSGGAHRSLEVVEVRDLTAGLTQIDTDPARRVLLVTCRDGQRSDGRLTRLLIETDEAAAPPTGSRPEHAL